MFLWTVKLIISVLFWYILCLLLTNTPFLKIAGFLKSSRKRLYSFAENTAS